jgi:Helix-turn-helix domain
MMGNERFDWEPFVPLIVHPLKVAIIEALIWMDRPLSPAELVRLFDCKEWRITHVAYHVRKLREAGILEIVRTRPVRGSTEKYHQFA